MDKNWTTQVELWPYACLKGYGSFQNSLCRGNEKNWFKTGVMTCVIHNVLSINLHPG